MAHADELDFGFSERGPASNPPPRSRSVESAFAVPGYRLIGRIGEGGMGAVFKAVHEASGRSVALKVAAIGLIADPRERDEARARLMREAQLLARVGSPHVVTVFDFGICRGEVGGRDEEVGYVAMELVAGTTLRALLDDRQVDVATALELTRQLAVGLEAVHRSRFVHRDLKPSNVLVTPMALGGAHLTIIDFGIVYSQSLARLTATDSVVGSAVYMAPEVFRDDQPTELSDLYAVGHILYELLTGLGPFPVAGRAAYDAAIIAMAAPVHPPCSLLPTIPEAVSRLAAGLLSKDPRRRVPKTAQAVADACKALARDLGDPPPREHPALDLVRAARRPAGSGSGSGSGERDALAVDERVGAVLARADLFQDEAGPRESSSDSLQAAPDAAEGPRFPPEVPLLLVADREALRASGCLIGRSSTAPLAVPVPTVSREHALLKLVRGPDGAEQLVLTCLSANGLVVERPAGSRSLVPGEKARLEPGASVVHLPGKDASLPYRVCTAGQVVAVLHRYSQGPA